MLSVVIRAFFFRLLVLVLGSVSVETSNAIMDTLKRLCSDQVLVARYLNYRIEFGKWVLAACPWSNHLCFFVLLTPSSGSI